MGRRRYSMFQKDEKLTSSLQEFLFFEGCKKENDDLDFNPRHVTGHWGKITTTALQNFLKSKSDMIEGCDPGKIDGIMGSDTMHALQAYLEHEGDLDKNGDGVVTQKETHEALSKLLDRELSTHHKNEDKISADLPLSIEPKNISAPIAQHHKPHNYNELKVSPITAPHERKLSKQSEMAKDTIENQLGQKDYMMLDKNDGRIIVVRDGHQVLNRPALTGYSKKDVIPDSAYDPSKTVDGHTKDERVTPAGSFDLSLSSNKDYGNFLKLNDVGTDKWCIAIHNVYTGTPSERRERRLATEKGDDNQISYGCINVDRKTMKDLNRIFKEEDGALPLHILPHNEDKTMAFLMNNQGPSIASSSRPSMKYRGYAPEPG